MFDKMDEENEDFVLGSDVAFARTKTIRVWEIIARANALLITAESLREMLEEDPSNPNLQEDYAYATYQYQDYLDRVYSA
jgi:hypothetical protein